MNCTVTNKKENNLSVECESLKCKNCSVVFELLDKELNTTESRIVAAGSKIIFEHKFSELNCSEFELVAFIFKENFNSSDKIKIEENIGKLIEEKKNFFRINC